MGGFGSLFVYTFTVFVKPQGAEFGWNRESISLGFAIAAVPIDAQGKRLRGSLGPTMKITGKIPRMKPENDPRLEHFCGFVRFARSIYPTRKSNRSTDLDQTCLFPTQVNTTHDPSIPILPFHPTDSILPTAPLGHRAAPFEAMKVPWRAKMDSPRSDNKHIF
jgi:hypothetical protein